MSISTMEQMGPVLVSDLPPLRTVPSSLAARLIQAVRHRLQGRAFERALGSAGHNELSDLLAQSRRG